jgi:pimeloyl-ACP methyl ester carboxylesterase
MVWLTRCRNGNVGEAAAELGLTRRVLGVRLDRYGINYKSFRNSALRFPWRPITALRSRDDDIAAVIRNLKIERVYLVGLSMGGYAALQFGLQDLKGAIERSGMSRCRSTCFFCE